MGVLRRKSPLFRRKSSRNVSAIEAEVDYIVQRSLFLQATQAQHEEVPTFARKEYQTGSLLGSGSFSTVHAIIGFKLSSNSSSKQRRRSFKQCSSSQHPLLASTTCSSQGSSSNLSLESSPKNPQELPQTARFNLTQYAFDDSGEARYAVKMVRKELLTKANKGSNHSAAFHNAAADLVVEAQYLAALDHPNILKLRGLAQGGCASFADGHDGFFFIVDRLQETLGDRITRWKQQQQQKPQEDLLALKANYALQIADALAYLHDRRILFRDLKPNNVGFQKDDPDTIQLFDFGLCRELPATADSYQDNNNDDDDDSNVAFQMSGAGTYLYMAPEVVNRRTYNLKADVYSWAFLFHEMIALERPFDEYTAEEHKEFVCEIGQRPSLTDFGLPQGLQTLLRFAWEQDPTERWTMRQVCRELQPILEDLRAVASPTGIETVAAARPKQEATTQPTMVPSDCNKGWTRRSLTRMSLLGRQAFDAVSELMGK